MEEKIKYVRNVKSSILLKKSFKMEDQLFFAKDVSYKMFKIVFLIIFLFSFYLSAQQKFIEGLEDIPSYKEMKYVEDSLILFDKIDGRYVSSESKGNYPLYEVKNFYKKILPNLGWKVERENLFSRGNENLELEFRSIKDETLIVFKIFPKY